MSDDARRAWTAAAFPSLGLDLPRRHHRRGVVMSRERQLQLVGALDAWSRAIRRDECGDWRINGTSGHIYADPAGGWQLYVAFRSARAWTAAKGRLGFCRVTQDGDDEGVLYLAAMPTKVQAAAIRKALGIRKRLEHSQQALERMRLNAFQPAGKEGFSGQDARDGAAPSHPAQMAAEIVHSERTGCGAGRLARSCHPTNGRATRPIAKPSTSSADRAGEDGGPVRGGYR